MLCPKRACGWLGRPVVGPLHNINEAIGWKTHVSPRELGLPPPNSRSGPGTVEVDGPHFDIAPRSRPGLGGLGSAIWVQEGGETRVWSLKIEVPKTGGVNDH